MIANSSSATAPLSLNVRRALQVAEQMLTGQVNDRQQVSPPPRGDGAIVVQAAREIAPANIDSPGALAVRVLGRTGRAAVASTAKLLEPDIDQIEIFTDALFRYAKTGFVSLRAFYENGSAKPFRISAVAIGSTLQLLNKQAIEVARMCAQSPEPVVFCPPIAAFRDRDRARENDIAAGLALSVECDQHALEARRKLSEILGEPTVAVLSGGKWLDPATGEIQDKRHLHWRLKIPATGEALKELKRARDIAGRLVGGDPSNKPVCHPIRWPGSWHRKSDPVLCRIESLDPDREIELAAAVAALKLACPGQSEPSRGKRFDGQADGADWAGLIAKVLSGDSYHEPLIRMAAKMLAAGTSDGAAVNHLRALMEASTGPRDDRWRARYDDIPRAVRTAREKFGRRAPVDIAASTASAADYGYGQDARGWRENTEPNNIGNRARRGRRLEMDRLSAVESIPVEWLWPDRIPRKFVLFTGPPDVGKTLAAIDIAARVTNAGNWPDGSGRASRGSVVVLTAEDGIADTIRPRAEAAGADLDRIHYLRAVIDADGRRSTFSLQADLAQLREAIAAIGDVALVIIDPVTAYLGAGAIDTHKTSDVRAVLSPLTEFVDEQHVTVLGITHPPKSVGGNAMNSATGSLAFIAAARSAYLFSREDETGRTLMLPIKNNLAPRKDGLAFRIHQRIVSESIVAPYLDWDSEPVTVTANEALAVESERTSGDRSALNEAMDFIRTELLGGEVEAAVVQKQALKAGITVATFRRARDELKAREGLKTRREGFGCDGKFFLSLPIDAHRVS
jgi:DNA polymerase III delta prime subunit